MGAAYSEPPAALGAASGVLVILDPQLDRGRERLKDDRTVGRPAAWGAAGLCRWAALGAADSEPPAALGAASGVLVILDPQLDRGRERPQSRRKARHEAADRDDLPPTRPPAVPLLLRRNAAMTPHRVVVGRRGTNDRLP